VTAVLKERIQPTLLQSQRGAGDNQCPAAFHSSSIILPSLHRVTSCHPMLNNTENNWVCTLFGGTVSVSQRYSAVFHLDES